MSDQIPRELQRVIEFLNGQMTATVVGVEVKQYVGAETTTIVPTVLGQTNEAETRKGSSGARTGRHWDEETFFAALAANQPHTEVAAARSLYNWADEQGWQHSYGSGGQTGSWIPVLTANQRQYRPIVISSNGNLTISFQTLATRPPFTQPETLRQLLDQLNQIPGVNLPADAIGRYPSIPLSVLTNPNALDKLTRILRQLAATAAAATSH